MPCDLRAHLCACVYARACVCTCVGARVRMCVHVCMLGLHTTGLGTWMDPTVSYSIPWRRVKGVAASGFCSTLPAAVSSCCSSVGEHLRT